MSAAARQAGSEVLDAVNHALMDVLVEASLLRPY
jgi:hypothetical protein